MQLISRLIQRLDRQGKNDVHPGCQKQRIPPEGRLYASFIISEVGLSQTLIKGQGVAAFLGPNKWPKLLGFAPQINPCRRLCTIAPA